MNFQQKYTMFVSRIWKKKNTESLLIQNNILAGCIYPIKCARYANCLWYN